MSDQIQAISAALAFIEDHLCEPITVADIAAAAGYSLYHFIRTFNQIVQHTPYDYLMRRRLSEAARTLLQSKRRVIDIALDFQFNNHETFTRTFGRLFGMPPSEWRQHSYPDLRLIFPALDPDDLENLNTLKFELPKLVALDEIFLAGLMTSFTTDAERLSDLWRNLRAILNRSSKTSAWVETPGKREFWGIRFRPPIPDGNSFYLAAVKILSLGATPGALVTKIIPAGDYLCLPLLGKQPHLDLGFTYLYHTFLPKAGLTMGEPLEIERFGVQREILIPVKGTQKSNLISSSKLNRSSEINESG